MNFLNEGDLIASLEFQALVSDFSNSSAPAVQLQAESANPVAMGDTSAAATPLADNDGSYGGIISNANRAKTASTGKSEMDSYLRIIMGKSAVEEAPVSSFAVKSNSHSDDYFVIYMSF